MYGLPPSREAPVTWFHSGIDGVASIMEVNTLAFCHHIAEIAAGAVKLIALQVAAIFVCRQLRNF